jgi:ssDNA-specific exonuclease RecJ
VFYVTDPANKKLHVVLPGKRHIVGVENVVDEEVYFDDVPPFSTGINTELVQESIERIYLWSDHQEGSYVKKQKAKKKN